MDENAKCPKCGSYNLDYWDEQITTRYFRIKNNGDISGKPYNISDCSTTGASGYRCNKCGCMWNSISGNILN